MGNPRLVPFKADHLLVFHHKDETNYLDNVRHAIDKERQGPAFTAVYGDAVLGCAGVQIAVPGYGVAWSVFSKEILRWPVWTTRTVKRALRDIIKAHNLHRVEMVALKDDRASVDWAVALGFSREQDGIAHCFTRAGQDVVRFELTGRR